jgi:predicted transcriptional regulator
MSQKVNARDAFIQLNDRIVKQKNYITFLQQQLDEKNIEYKKILDQNVELKQQLQLEKENRFIQLQKEERKVVKEVVKEDIQENEVIYEQVTNGISFKITEKNNEPTSNVNKKSKMNINFNDISSLKGLTLGDLMRN